MSQSDLDVAFQKAQQLEDLRQQDLLAVAPLVDIYTYILEHLEVSAEHSEIRAAVQTNLGVAYSELPTGNRLTNLQSAIGCFQEALRFWTLEETPAYYASAQINLGAAYQELRTGDLAENLQQAIVCYREALRAVTFETSPLDYISAKINLGNAYRELPTGDRAANLQQAIACYQEALRLVTFETSPLDYISAKINLGNAYRELPTGDRAANLQQAIASYQEALHFVALETSPLDYALLQSNLGVVYSELPTGDRAANFLRAISCYQEALRVWTPDAAPLKYAIAQNNLGNAYHLLPTGDRVANLKRAMTCYQEALRLRPPEIDPVGYAMTQVNLGIVYTDLPTGDRESNLEQAIACYREALRFVKPETAPLAYASAKNNLGNAYHLLLTGDRAANLEQAINCYKEALHIWTPESAPFEYARVQVNLGASYNELPGGDRATNLASTIRCYQEALRFFTKFAAPFECRHVNQALADLYFAQREWQLALKRYQTAIEVGELLYQSGLSAESKDVETKANTGLYRRAAFSAVRCGETVPALLLLERGKTRLLIESLRLRVPRPPHVPDTIWDAFSEAAATIRNYRIANTPLPGAEMQTASYPAFLEEHVQEADAALKVAIRHIQAYAPEFFRALDASTIQSALPDETTVLIAFCITSQGSLAFVVGHDSNMQVVDLPHFTQGDLSKLAFEGGTKDHASNDWLGAYLHYRDKKTSTTFNHWKAAITSNLARLGHDLLTPVISALQPNTRRLILVPSAELFLFPLHAAPLSDTNADLLCDRYEVTYAPSIEILTAHHAKEAQKKSFELYAIINPQADPTLTFTSMEGRAVAEFFKKSTVDEGPVGTKTRAKTEMRGRGYIHMACHGRYMWGNPSLSGLELADGRLTVLELQNEAAVLSASRLVVLSACETGISDIMKGSAEEYVGMPSGFLFIGVPCIVSSLWSVPDFSTALLMERFYYYHLSGGMTIAAALHEAQRWVRRSNVGEIARYAEQQYPHSQKKEKAELLKLIRYYRQQEKLNADLHPFEHPYYWAAFAVSGL